MAILSGYEYDIFISYRHNDNRSGWVTEFVNALQEELASTIKEPVTIYFDKNPHDGLLETHNVDKSLEGKLKCLIFIPIISQTYCDPKSFAWQHEFCAFNKLPKDDQFGRDIKLSNGNVSSRILPVKIHELDAEDKATIENEIGGVLRAIEFIYKEAGVNRPLKSSDSKADNQSKTDYRNQVNKVANAIKEIISSIKNPAFQTARITINEQPTTTPKQNRKILIASLVLVCVVAISYFLYQPPAYRTGRRTTTNEQSIQLDKSIAVLPFVDMSPAHDQEYFGDGVAEEIINVLAQSEELKVIARSSSFQFKGKNEDLKKVGEMLGVATILEGSIRKSADQIRITAQLIKTSDGSHVWSKTFDRSPKDIFAVQDEIAREVASALKATLMQDATSAYEVEWNEQAKKEYQLATYYYDRRAENDLNLAMEHYKKSIALDSSRAIVYSLLSATCYLGNGGFGSDEAKECDQYLQKALKMDPTQPEGLIYNSFQYLNRFEFQKAEEEMKKALHFGPRNAVVLRNVARILSVFGKVDEAIRMGEEAVSLDPLLTISYSNLSLTYYRAGQYDKSILNLKKARELSKDRNDNMVVLYLLNNQVQEAIRENDKLSGERRDFHEILIQYKLQHSEKASSLLNSFIKNRGSEKNFPWRCAQAAAFIGNKELAFAWLEKCYKVMESGLVNVKLDPLFISLRNEPRFIELIERMNFPEN